MIKYEEKEYDLRFSMNRVMQIEAALQASIMGLMVKSNGALSLKEVITLISYSAIDTESGQHINPTFAEKIAKDFLEDKGYPEAILMVNEALQRDCPFFFQAD